jgi:SAM-dependent methyltransferase
MHLGAVIAIFSGGFFVAAMVCHGELARRKPDPSYLTGFFLMVSIGGAAGGLFVGVVAPYLFRAYFELPLGIGACGILVAILIATDPSTWFGRSRYGFLAPTIAVAVLCGFLTSVIRETTSGYRLMVRNFYGGLRVSDEGGADDRNAKRKLIHGVINHGMQLLAPDRRREPASYYCTGSGVAVAIVHRLPEVPQRVGVIGLGAGSLAAYGRAKDVIRYYEINPLVVTVARSEFTYLGDTPAKVEIALGDARLSLEREPSQQFDVLAVDAFSSDSIPVHLLTREAFDLYFRHLRADGILAVHISNKHLDLKPVVERVATAVNIPARVVDTDDDEEHCFGSTWVLLTRRAGFFESLGAERKLETLTARAGFRPWTDDFSNLYQILK